LVRKSDDIRVAALACTGGRTVHEKGRSEEGRSLEELIEGIVLAGKGTSSDLVGEMVGKTKRRAEED